MTLAEASVILSVPIGTLNSWRGRKLIHPTGRAINPDTNRLVRVYDLDDLVAMKGQANERQPQQENP